MDALAAKDVAVIAEADRIEKVRLAAAMELHAMCAKFVRDLNGLLNTTELTLDPPAFEPDQFHDGSSNLFQINVRGRILQIEFEVTENPISTENFRHAYVLQGAIRGFNQELLEHDAIEEELLFYCVGEKTKGWMIFDARTYRTGQLKEDYFATLLERLV
ncbi:MAG: hypothetical protein M3Z36_15420 [Acidobacteriota bacterium]|nr:hypothetical protein [Acidobacteriota bacterium]